MPRLVIIFLFGVSLFALASARAAETTDPLVKPEHRLTLDDPAWVDLLLKIEQRPDASASFEERRFFPFKKTPTLLQGEVRVSTKRGLSLHYVTPDDRTVIIDESGVLLRELTGDTTPPSDPRASVANTAMLHLLRFDLKALAENFEIYGERKESAWTLALVPKVDSIRRTLGQITVSGENAEVRRIELRRSLTQRVEILVAPPRTPARPFTPEELKQYFR